MKEMNEYKAEVFSRMERGIKERKKKRNRIIAYTTPLCLCLVMLVCFSVWQSDLFKNPPIDTSGENSSGSDYTSEPTDKGEAATKDEADMDGDVKGYGWPEKNDKPTSDEISDKKLGLNLNIILGKANGARLYYDPALYDEKTLTEKEALDYLGLDFSTLEISSKYQGVGIKNIITDKFGTVAYDTFSISFGKNITILTSKVGLPYDCIYELESKNETVFTSVKDKYATQVTAIVGTDNEGFYYSDFSVGGVNYRVSMENCYKTSEFYNVVKSIIDLSVE